MENLEVLSESAVKRVSYYSMRQLEHVIGVDRDELREIARSAGAYYSPFELWGKPRPFQRNFPPLKARHIDCPVGRLKEVQKLLDRKMLKPVALPSYLCGGVKGRSLLDNITIHLGSKVLVTIDIRNFFPSITTRQVYRVWRDIVDCSPEIASLLTKLTTFERHLPQGAPTSTMLANLVLHSVDSPIRESCALLRVSYSTWVDDIAFSGDNARLVINTAVGALMKAGFSVPHKKTRIMGPGSAKLLTNLLVGRFPSVMKERADRVRSGLNKLQLGLIEPAEMDLYLKSLHGNIAQLSAIDPAKGSRLRDSFAAALRSLPPALATQAVLGFVRSL